MNSTNTRVRFFNPGLTYQKLKPELDAKYFEVMESGQLILRSEVTEFEDALANFVGTKYAVALNSCTDALYLALRFLKIGPGDAVIVPSRTFVASAQVIVQVGATPVYVDVDGSLDLTEGITLQDIKAVIPVHIEGEIATGFEKTLEIARERGWHVIEDAAQALGATHNGLKAGSFGIAGCFSFYPAKILGAFGDAGALTTNDEEIYRYVKDARNHFKDDARDWGVNSRLDNLQAAFLNVRIARMSDMLGRREAIALRYFEKIGDFYPIILPPHTPGRVWQDYIVRTRSKEERDSLYTFLKERRVETMKNNYPFPVAKLPLAQAYEDQTLRLPCNENLTDEEVDFVVEMVLQFYKELYDAAAA